MSKDKLHWPVRDAAHGMLDFFDLCSRALAPLKNDPENLDPLAIESQELVISALDSYAVFLPTLCRDLPTMIGEALAATCDRESEMRSIQSVSVKFKVNARRPTANTSQVVDNG